MHPTHVPAKPNVSLAYRDITAKSNALTNVLEQMPHEHFETLRMLMLHLHGYVRIFVDHSLVLIATAE